jgi:hypothetical protein
LDPRPGPRPRHFLEFPLIIQQQLTIFFLFNSLFLSPSLFLVRLSLIPKWYVALHYNLPFCQAEPSRSQQTHDADSSVTSSDSRQRSQKASPPFRSQRISCYGTPSLLDQVSLPVCYYIDITRVSTLLHSRYTVRRRYIPSHHDVRRILPKPSATGQIRIENVPSKRIQ